MKFDQCFDNFLLIENIFVKMHQLPVNLACSESVSNVKMLVSCGIQLLIHSVNDLAPNRRQAIFWGIDGLDHASLGLDELSMWSLWDACFVSCDRYQISKKYLSPTPCQPWPQMCPKELLYEWIYILFTSLNFMLFITYCRLEIMLKCIAIRYVFRNSFDGVVVN